jgi:hypothetical protein
LETLGGQHVLWCVITDDYTHLYKNQTTYPFVNIVKTVCEAFPLFLICGTNYYSYRNFCKMKIIGIAHTLWGTMRVFIDDLKHSSSRQEADQSCAPRARVKNVWR